MKRSLLKLWRRPSPLILSLLLVVGSLLCGLGLSVVLNMNEGAIAQPLTIASPKAVDAVTERTQRSQQAYLQNCASCHIPIPPELLPTQSWADILENPEQHFGVNLRQPDRRRGTLPITNVDIRLMWDYVQGASRTSPNNDVPPSRVRDSRFFAALHPKVATLCAEGFPCPKRVTIQTCVTCHTAAQQFDYSQLTPEWEVSP